MSTSITHYFAANVNGGPSLVVNNSIDYEAFEVVDIVLTADGSDVEVNLSADSGARLLVITSSAYDDIAYDVDGGANAVKLDGPHLLIGEGILALLGSAPGKLTFSKGSGEDAEITILVGRDATP